MNIKLLDCTLRDGGFLNNWRFGSEAISSFLDEMAKTCVDIIECGYIQASDEASVDHAIYSASMRPPIRRTSQGSFPPPKYYCMVDYGKTALKEIPDCSQIGIDGIRLAFHLDDVIPAVSFCEKLKLKGYQIIAHPMNTPAYSTSEFRNMINMFSQIDPYAIYLVDSYGTMWPNTLEPYIAIAENTIPKEIFLGFHFHNNLQQAMTNTFFALSKSIIHDIILDATICGVGRGGGNLDFFPLLAYLIHCGKDYSITPFLTVVDSSLNRFIREVAHSLSIVPTLTSMYKSHPNYGVYLEKIQCIKYTDINKILSEADAPKLTRFDPSYFNQLVSNYMGKNGIGETRNGIV